MRQWLNRARAKRERDRSLTRIDSLIMSLSEVVKEVRYRALSSVCVCLDIVSSDCPLLHESWHGRRSTRGNGGTKTRDLTSIVTMMMLFLFALSRGDVDFEITYAQELNHKFCHAQKEGGVNRMFPRRDAVQESVYQVGVERCTLAKGPYFVTIVKRKLRYYTSSLVPNHDN